MLNIAFCDDDQEILNQLQNLLDQYRKDKNVLIQCLAFQSPLELLAQIEAGVRFDILFLDVIMPGENGIHVAGEIRQYDETMKIIFLTSSAEFAVQSYTVGAYFYQLKPIWTESFFRLMDAVTSECEKEQENALVLCCKSGITRINLSKLEYCEVIGRTLTFHLENGQVLESSGSLDELSSQLAPYHNFLRPHRSFLINMEYIQNISNRAITMTSHVQIPVPHGKCSDIKNVYLEYVFDRKQVVIS